MRGQCSYVCPQTWLNEARTNIGLSPAMGFLNENDSLAYFEILGELPSGLSFTVGFIMTLCFLLLSVGFSGARKDIPRITLMFKGEFRAQYKLGANERAGKIQKNEPSLTFMCQLVLEISQFKVIFPPHKGAAIFMILSLVPIKRKSNMTS